MNKFVKVQSEQVKRNIKRVSKAVTDAYVGVGRAVYENIGESAVGRERFERTHKKREFPMVPSHKTKK